MGEPELSDACLYKKLAGFGIEFEFSKGEATTKALALNGAPPTTTNNT